MKISQDRLMDREELKRDGVLVAYTVHYPKCGSH